MSEYMLRKLGKQQHCYTLAKGIVLNKALIKELQKDIKLKYKKYRGALQQHVQPQNANYMPSHTKASFFD